MRNMYRFALMVSMVLCSSNLMAAITSQPQYACWKAETIEHKLPKGYEAAVIWFQAVTISASHSGAIDGPAKVIIDYERVIEKQPDNTENVVYERKYGWDNRPLSSAEGGLYLRRPWFGGNDYHEPMSNSLIDGGLLTIDVATRPQRVAHWWTDRVSVTPGSRYFAEVRFEVVGMAAIQLGSDWWRTLDAPYAGYDATCKRSNNCEAWVSGWYENTDGDFITVRVPLNNRPPIINSLTAQRVSRGAYVIKAAVKEYDSSDQADLQYSWDFNGDQVFDQTTNVSRVSHSFPKGAQRIYCRVCDPDGACAEAGPLKFNVR